MLQLRLVALWRGIWTVTCIDVIQMRSRWSIWLIVRTSFYASPRSAWRKVNGWHEHVVPGVLIIIRWCVRRAGRWLVVRGCQVGCEGRCQAIVARTPHARGVFIGKHEFRVDWGPQLEWSLWIVCIWPFGRLIWCKVAFNEELESQFN